MKKRVLGILLSLVMVMELLPGMSMTARAAEDVLEIGSVEDWNAFAASVNGGNTYADKTVELTADVGATTDQGRPLYNDSYTSYGDLSISYSSDGYTGSYDNSPLA